MKTGSLALSFVLALFFATVSVRAQTKIRSLTNVIEGHAVGGVTVDLVGNIYVADFGEYVWKITPEGKRDVFASGCLNGRAMFFRSVISDITPNSSRFEDAFSDDGGKTWKVKGIAMDTRAKGESPRQNSDAAKPTPKNSSPENDGQHDFDFEIGTWKTHLWRLVDPLIGSTKWVEYEGTSIVRKIWDGRANLVELVADGPVGHFEGLNLRLYNPQSRQWSLNFAGSKSGTLGPPTVGEFNNGRGEFFSQETLNGRAILVRFVISDITPDSCRFEQAFSDDGGKNWEVNWIAIDTRVKGEA
jgi:hypothetical protein